MLPDRGECVMIDLNSQMSFLVEIRCQNLLNYDTLYGKQIEVDKLKG